MKIATLGAISYICDLGFKTFFQTNQNAFWNWCRKELDSDLTVLTFYPKQIGDQSEKYFPAGLLPHSPNACPRQFCQTFLIVRVLHFIFITYSINASIFRSLKTYSFLNWIISINFKVLVHYAKYVLKHIIKDVQYNKYHKKYFFVTMFSFFKNCKPLHHFKWSTIEA